MAITSWLEVDFLRLLSKHTSSCIAALASYALVAEIALYLAPVDTWVRELIEGCEKGVLALIFAAFMIRFIIEFWKLSKRSIRGGSSLSAFLVA